MGYLGHALILIGYQLIGRSLMTISSDLTSEDIHFMSLDGGYRQCHISWSIVLCWPLRAVALRPRLVHWK